MPLLHQASLTTPISTRNNEELLCRSKSICLLPADRLISLHISKHCLVGELNAAILGNILPECEFTII